MSRITERQRYPHSSLSTLSKRSSLTLLSFTTSVAFTIVGGRVMVAEVSEIADDPLVEIGELLLCERISIKAGRIRATFEESLNLVAL